MLYFYKSVKVLFMEKENLIEIQFKKVFLDRLKKQYSLSITGGNHEE